MEERTVGQVRPYFVPEGLDLDSVPPAVKAAFEAILQPSYDELVLQATTSLERSAGVTLVFLLSLEVLDHFEIGRNLNLTGLPDEQSAADRDELIVRHLRLVGAKHQAANFLMRLRGLRARFDNGDPLRGPIV